MDIQFFLFDWSGTISDDRVPVFKANQLMCQEFGIAQNPSFNAWIRSASVSPSQWFRERGVKKSAEEIYEIYRRRFNEVITNDASPTVYPDAEETLAHLKNRGIRLAILSAHPEYNLKKEADTYGLFDYFDLIVGDCRDKAQGLKELATMLSAEPTHALYIGDTIYDIRAAKEAGMHSAGITTGYHTPDAIEAEEPDYLLTSLSELITTF